MSFEDFLDAPVKLPGALRGVAGSLSLASLDSPVATAAGPAIEVSDRAASRRRVFIS